MKHFLFICFTFKRQNKLDFDTIRNSLIFDTGDISEPFRFQVNLHYKSKAYPYLEYLIKNSFIK